MLNPNEAPDGYVAVSAEGNKGCAGCALERHNPLCLASACSAQERIDKTEVIFVRRSTGKFKTKTRTSVRIELTTDELNQIVLEHLGLTDKNATVSYLTGQGSINATVSYETEEVT